jgi:HSP20 family protein
MSERNVTENTQATAGQEATLIPAVDIFEDAQGITLKVDLPGVSRERLSIRVDKDTLSIDGDVQVDIPEGTEPLYADLRATHFRRSFTLSQELETAHISAQMNDGVLTLHVPKRAEVQPRKIEVKVE